LPNRSKLQVEDGSETPEALVAFTSQVCSYGETYSVVLVMAVMNVTMGVIQYMHDDIAIVIACKIVGYLVTHNPISSS
jgi:hypothetical protein